MKEAVWIDNVEVVLGVNKLIMLSAWTTLANYLMLRQDNSAIYFIDMYKMLSYGIAYLFEQSVELSWGAQQSAKKT